MLNDLYSMTVITFLSAVKSALKQMYSELWTNILDDSYGFNLLLPDDDDSMAERGNALSVWVQGFQFRLWFAAKRQTSVIGRSKRSVD